MDQSPYTPGAGHNPPVLAGRDGLLRDWHLVLNDIVSSGRVRAQDMILAGPRGVGKTVTVPPGQSVEVSVPDLDDGWGVDIVPLSSEAGG